MTNWILVAESRRARLFASEGVHFTLSEVADFTHPQASRQGDNPAGHVFGASSGTRHAAEPQITPKAKEAQAFAVELVQYLQHAFSQQRFAKLILVAAPEFLGELRSAMPASLSAAVSGSVAKDLVSCSNAEISNYLSAQTSLR